MIINVIDNLKEIIEYIDCDEISSEEIKQRLEMIIEELENIESENDGYEVGFEEEGY